MKSHRHLREDDSPTGEAIRRFELDRAHKYAFPRPSALALEVLRIVGGHARYRRPISIDEIQTHTRKPWSAREIGRALQEAAVFLGHYGARVELRRRMAEGPRPRRMVYWLFEKP